MEEKYFSRDIINKIVVSVEEVEEAKKNGQRKVVSNHEGTIEFYIYNGKSYITDIVIYKEDDRERDNCDYR